MAVSCSIAKAERSKAKDARQMPAPNKPCMGKNKKRKKHRPFIIMYKFAWAGWSDIGWWTLGKYTTLEFARTSVSTHKRKWGDTRNDPYLNRYKIFYKKGKELIDVTSDR